MRRPESEAWIQGQIVGYLKSKGYRVVRSSTSKSRGVDIGAYHPSRRRYYFVEVKPEPNLRNKSKNQMRDNYFMSALGQITTRMTQESARCALGLPDTAPYLRKLRKIPRRVRMKLKLDVFVVSNSASKMQERVGRSPPFSLEFSFSYLTITIFFGFVKLQALRPEKLTAQNHQISLLVLCKALGPS